MHFSEKLIRLRAEKGLSQEGLANELGVSRQAVSKWEAGAAMPEIAKLVAMAQLFDVSLDYLAREDVEERKPQSAPAGNDDVAEQLRELSGFVKRQQPYEYKSEASFFGLPLVHVHLSRGRGRPAVAKGIIAIGDMAVGIVALGGISAGIIALGGLSLGLLLALGGLSAGLFSLGGVALASELAVGAVASARVALGDAVQGAHTLQIHAASETEIAAFLQAHCPEAGAWLIQLLSAVAH
ncbi:MAG: helix-turn-helix transcriptional regulator [bacterium]|nr:helix-turn-helix transcriptional regulator [bacterium]